jgi:site-specific DNA recombinase
MRALGARRLSNRTDESTSIERQGEQIQLSAQLRGDELVHMTQDTDVSGAVSPFERADLGPWLTDPAKVAKWDVLIVAKLDRLTRSLIHFNELIDWLDRNSKTLVSVSESLDLSTSHGRMFANILAMFGQFERERMSERRAERARDDKERGWYGGGRYKFGYKPVKVDSHFELEPDPEKVQLLNWMGNQILTGNSRSGIARELEKREIPAPFGGKKWARDTVARVLTGSQELLVESIRYHVIDALDNTKHTFTRRGNAPMLLNVAFCGKCKQPLYAQRGIRRAKYYYEHYYCKARCGARLIPMRELDDKVTNDFTAKYSWVPIIAKDAKPGVSHKSEIMAIERQYHALDLDDPDLETKRSELLRQRKALKDAPTAADQFTLKPTGQTVADYWPNQDKDTRRLFLIDNRVKVYADRTADGKIRVRIEDPDPIRSIFLLGGLEFPPGFRRNAETMFGDDIDKIRELAQQRYELLNE